MTLATPAWLLGLLLVPVIWYLHRSGPVLRRVPVASLDLWQDSRARAAQAGERRPADAAWLRRAAILTLLCVTLAGPQWPRSAERVTLWVDDSLSMQTLEGNVSRLDRGLRLAQAALRDGSVRDVAVRPLSDPTRLYNTAGVATMRAVQAGAGLREPRPPAPDALAPGRVHWVVTDGADDGVNAWLGNSRISRVFQVASNERNIGIARVTIRPQPADPNAGAVQVVLRNGGAGPETRIVQVSTGAGAPVLRPVSIDAGASLTLNEVVRLPLSRLTVRLSPGDALPQDDVAVVDGTPLTPVPTHIDPSCPLEVTRAIRAHPALRITSGRDAGLIVDCGSAWNGDAPVPRVALRRGLPVTFDASSVVWSQLAAARPPPEARFTVRALGRLDAPRSMDEVLMAAGEVPLVIRRAGLPRVVETSLDLDAPELKATETVPLMLALLADAALEASLLDRSAGIARDETASMVASRAALHPPRQPAQLSRGDEAPMVLPFLVLACLLLAWDALALAQRVRRDFFPRAHA